MKLEIQHYIYMLPPYNYFMVMPLYVFDLERLPLGPTVQDSNKDRDLSTERRTASSQSDTTDPSAATHYVIPRDLRRIACQDPATCLNGTILAAGDITCARLLKLETTTIIASWPRYQPMHLVSTKLYTPYTARQWLNLTPALKSDTPRSKTSPPSATSTAPASEVRLSTATPSPMSTPPRYQG